MAELYIYIAEPYTKIYKTRKSDFIFVMCYVKKLFFASVIILIQVKCSIKDLRSRSIMSTTISREMF